MTWGMAMVWAVLYLAFLLWYGGRGQALTASETEDFLADTGAYNAGKLSQTVPSVQFYSTNPRNSAINIRGLGAPFGLTNDGIEQGVGLYVDGVYFARPASATLDFLDVEQIEVLRGPQGTLYGQGSAGGTLIYHTRDPNLSQIEARGEASIGRPLTRATRTTVFR